MNSQVLGDGVREQALRGVDVVDIARWVVSQLGESPAFFPFAAAFFRGLKVPVETLYQMVGWNGVGGSGDVSDNDLRAVLAPYAERLTAEK